MAFESEKKIKILVLTPYYEPAYIYGGPSKSIPNLCKSLNKNGASVKIFTTNANGKEKFTEIPSNSEVMVDNVSVIYFSRVLQNNYFFSPKLLFRLIRQIKKFDLIQIHGIFTFISISASIVALINKKPYVIFPHGMLMPWAFNYKRNKKFVYMKLIERFILSKAKAIIGTSKNEVSSISSFNFGVPIFEFPNGFEFKDIGVKSVRGRFREYFKIDESSLIILMLGRLHQIKRPDLVLESFIMLSSKYDHLNLIFAGPDEKNLIPQILSRAKEALIEKKVHFTGYLSPKQVKEILSEVDIFINSSESENFGMAIIEAIAEGLPVIVSNKISLSEVITLTNCGYVCELTVEDITEKLEKLISHPEELREKGKNGQKYVLDHYDINNISKNLIEQYKHLLNLSKNK